MSDQETETTDFTPLDVDELIDALHNERSSTNPNMDAAANAKYETLTWVLSLVEDPEARAEEDQGEVDEAQAERDARFEEHETGVPAGETEIPPEESEPDEEPEPTEEPFLS